MWIKGRVIRVKGRRVYLRRRSLCQELGYGNVGLHVSSHNSFVIMYSQSWLVAF